jgi:hypothetical protein
LTRSSLKAEHLTEFGAKLVEYEVFEQVAHIFLMWGNVSFILRLEKALVVLLLFQLGESRIESLEASHDLLHQSISRLKSVLLTSLTQGGGTLGGVIGGTGTGGYI